jgi:hypothetical protein
MAKLSGDSYANAEVARLLRGYAKLVSSMDVHESIPDPAAPRLSREWVQALLADIDRGLERLPEDLYSVVRLRGLERQTNAGAAAQLGIHANTASKRWRLGVAWLTSYVNRPSGSRPLRSLEWREWARGLDSSHLALGTRVREETRGRPPLIPDDLAERVVRLYVDDGVSLQSIADRLNAEDVRSPGRRWRPSSFRSLLRRYGVEPRPAGRRPRPGGIHDERSADDLGDSEEIIDRFRTRSAAKR